MGTTIKNHWEWLRQAICGDVEGRLWHCFFHNLRNMMDKYNGHISLSVIAKYQSYGDVEV